MTSTHESNDNFSDEEFLYRGIHKTYWGHWKDLEKIYPNFFSLKKIKERGSMSFDRSKYATPKATLIHQKAPTLDINGIAEVNIEKLRERISINNYSLNISYTPTPINQAHTDLVNWSGNISEIRMKLSEIFGWAPNMKPTGDLY